MQTDNAVALVTGAGSGLGFSPYVGGGIGVGFVDISGSGRDFDALGLDDSATGLAWQVGAGIRITRHFGHACCFVQPVPLVLGG